MCARRRGAVRSRARSPAARLGRLRRVGQWGYTGAGVVVLLGLAEAHRVRWLFHAGQQRREQLFFGVDQGFAAVVGELVLIAHGERTCRARLDAQSTEDAAQVVDLVDAPVTLAG